MPTRRGRPALPVGQLGKTTSSVEDGIYVARAALRLPNGKRVRLSGKSRASDRDALADLHARAAVRMSAWDVSDDFSPDMTFRELATKWLEKYRVDAPVPKPQTIQRHESSLNAHILPEFGDLRIRELSNRRLRKWVQGLAASHLAEARNSKVVLRHVLSLGADEGACEPSLYDFDGVRLAVPRKQPRAITQDELSMLRDKVEADRVRPRSGPKSRKAHDDLLDAIDIALATSLRISEVLGITSDDVALDSKQPVLRVTRKVEYVSGRGYVLGDVKTTTTKRGIPLPPFAVDIIEARIQRYGEGLIFRSSRGTGGPISQNNLRRLLRSIVEGTELEWVTPHSARKTVLTAVNRQLGSAVAAAVAGHADEELIKSTYGERESIAPDVTDITQALFSRRIGKS